MLEKKARIAIMFTKGSCCTGRFHKVFETTITKEETNLNKTASHIDRKNIKKPTVFLKSVVLRPSYAFYDSC